MFCLRLPFFAVGLLPFLLDISVLVLIRLLFLPSSVLPPLLLSSGCLSLILLVDPICLSHQFLFILIVVGCFLMEAWILILDEP